MEYITHIVIFTKKCVANYINSNTQNYHTTYTLVIHNTYEAYICVSIVNMFKNKIYEYLRRVGYIYNDIINCWTLDKLMVSLQAWGQFHFRIGIDPQFQFWNWKRF